MILFSPDGKAKVDCHPTQIENMKANGWTEKDPTKLKTKPATKKESK